MIGRQKDDRRPRLAVATALAALALAGAGLVQAEVIGAKPPDAGDIGVAIDEAPVMLECWQDGRRIIHQGGLAGVAVKALTRKGAVAFRQGNDRHQEIFLLSFDGSLCLVSPED